MELTPEHIEAARKEGARINEAIERAKAAPFHSFWKEWLVDVPEYHHDGVDIEQFVITEDQAWLDQLRTAANPQRPDRSIQVGTYTRLSVDGILWMTDTPAEIRDLLEVDDAMGRANGGSMLIVGLGLGVVLNRAIVGHGMQWIDVVEREQRVIDAVGPYYQALAELNGITLNIYCEDIHRLRVPTSRRWDVGFFDIWADIDSDDMPEVTRLRKRFSKRLGTFIAWAQSDRIGQRQRIKNKTGWY